MSVIQGLPDVFDKFGVRADQSGIYEPPAGGPPVLVTAKPERNGAELGELVGILFWRGEPLLALPLNWWPDEEQDRVREQTMPFTWATFRGTRSWCGPGPWGPLP